MSKENPLWGAPRIHGELLKLGFDAAESTVSKYMVNPATISVFSKQNPCSCAKIPCSSEIIPCSVG